MYRLEKKLRRPFNQYLIVSPDLLDYYTVVDKQSHQIADQFLGIQKALELVDNGINEFLLISLINSNKQNSQK